jgi:branched-subunit amino acid aminotransferase/4-amino-4-deoxychorismate lyase
MACFRSGANQESDLLVKTDLQHMGKPIPTFLVLGIIAVAVFAITGFVQISRLDLHLRRLQTSLDELDRGVGTLKVTVDNLSANTEHLNESIDNLNKVAKSFYISPDESSYLSSYGYNVPAYPSTTYEPSRFRKRPK